MFSRARPMLDSAHFPAGPGVEAAAAQHYHFLVYADKDEHPCRVECVAGDLGALVRHVQQGIGRTVLRLSAWDDDFAQYVPLRALAEIRGTRAKLWAETAGVRIAPVSEAHDPLEYKVLLEHVDRLGQPQPQHAYEMTAAHRVSHPELEALFQARRKTLLDERVRTSLLFYTNNARPSEHVVQHGFSVPELRPPYPNGIVFATDIDAQPAAGTEIKFLLCEVAVGRSFAVRGADRVSHQMRGFDLREYDSLMNWAQRDDGNGRIDEFVVFDPDQAIPRYIVTCTVAKGSGGATWNRGAMGCPYHPGEALKLWCIGCRELICPYCMTIGAHRSHEAREVAEVATFERQVLARMARTLDETLRRRQETAAELELAKCVLATDGRAGDDNVRRAVATLHQQLAAEEQRLVTDGAARRGAAVAQLDRAAEVLQMALAELHKKHAATAQLLALPIDGNPAACTEFLSGLVLLQETLQAAPSFDDTAPPPVDTPAIPTNVVTEMAERGIASLALGRVEPTDGAKAPQAESEELGRLRDIETGHIWVIADAATRFSAGQTNDVFSDKFTLLGRRWEARIASQPDGHLSAFVHAANHNDRMDFRLTLVSPGGWYTRHASDWVEQFRGRGWGVKPFVDRKSVLERYIADGVLKLVITPVGGLY
jgi:hypothetical protein